MSRILRIGAQILPGDPFWVQVREAVSQQAYRLGVTLVPIEITEHPETFTEDKQGSLLEELLALELDALIGMSLSESLIGRLLASGFTVVSLDDSAVQHPHFICPRGLYDAAHMAGVYLAEKLGQGHVLGVGGLMEVGRENGSSRVAGIQDALRAYPRITFQHLPSYWPYDKAYQHLLTALRQVDVPQAIFGVSDPIAFAARDAGRELGLVDDATLIVGINGDPKALAAIAEGSMSATVETSAAQFGAQAVDLAYRAAHGEPLPPHFRFKLRLVTSANVAEVAMQKLISLAELPSRLVGINRQLEQNRLTQLETSAAINRRVGALLNREQLAQEIADLIRVNYGYDEVQLLLWSPDNQLLVRDYPASHPPHRAIPLSRAGLLAEALRRNEPIFIPDTQHSPRFAPDPAWPDTRSRVVLPIRLGEAILGLLDLHSQHPTLHLPQELIGLQSLADQLGIAMRNAELYSEAVHAKEVAEQADRLKTRLLANVSHELRAPLNVILGYSQSALGDPNPYGITLPPELRRDLQHIYRSGDHLMRLINDLLDLSRAEIGALDLFPDTIATRSLLEEVFRSMADQSASAASHPPSETGPTWRLALPAHLPMLQADPLRLRQILLNLLSNARKFTTHGEIVLGAEIEPPYLHLWVQDTGIGIPVDLQERIFEPFVSMERQSQRGSGVGLGLTITRHLIALHAGTMTLESQIGLGSTFHVYLPLPNLAGEPLVAPPPAARPVLLLVSAHERPTPPITDLCQRRGLGIYRVRDAADLAASLRETQPLALAWDVAHASPGEWALIQQLRGHPQFSRLPFIFFGQESQAAMGITSVLIKPVNSQALVDAMRDLASVEATRAILVVDDDPDARAFYQRLAAEALPGYSVSLAEDGAQALASLEQATPTLVILDLMMPHVDGFTVLEKMRSHPRTRHVPVLVLSGRILSYEDVRRLDYARVTFHSKNILSIDEVVPLFQRIVGGDASLPQPTSTLVKRALAYLHQHYRHNLSRQDIAQAVGVSENYLSQIFRHELSLSPWDYLNRLRIHRAKELLHSPDASITEVAVQVGFSDPAYFSRVFRKYVGQSPQAYRQAVT
ncbi:MAG: helix-turn-helix domain-containing protein [Anaerolineae bacterium]|nr:helix-turn-helix domain-containing protein [Anaerolineae bacterium]